MKKRKIAVVTGADGGIGSAICKDLEKDGIKVIRWIRKSSKKDGVVSCDLSDFEQISDTCDLIVKKYGVPNIIVNNAGYYIAREWEEYMPKEALKVLQVNTMAPFFITQYFCKQWLKKKKKKKAVLINVTSVSGHLGSRDMFYAASKAGLAIITRSMARRLSENGIRFVNVAPGPIETKMAAKIHPDARQKYKEGIMMKRFGLPKEVSSIIRFLVSDDASYVNGTTWTVDGGL